MEKATCPSLQLVAAKQIVREYVQVGKHGWLADIQDENSTKAGFLAINQAEKQAHNLQNAKQLKQGLTDLLSEFADVFEPPGSPHPPELKHRIILQGEQ